MHANLIRTLTEIGLSEKEAMVYISMLSLGDSTILKISKNAGIKRPTAYGILDSLMEKGLATKVEFGFKKLYSAEDPDKLLLLLNSRKSKLIEKLPVFKSLRNISIDQHYSRNYEGLEAIKSLYDSILINLEEDDEYLVIGNSEYWYGLDPKYFKEFARKRLEIAKRKNIKLRLILQDGRLARELKEKERYPVENVKLLPSDIVLMASIAITPRQLVIHQTKGRDHAVVIENKSIIETHRELFNALWETATD